MSSYSEQADEYSLRDYLAILRRRWILITVPLALAAGLTVYRQTRQVDVYVSTSRVLLGNSAAQDVLNPSFQSNSFLVRELSNEISLATSDAATTAVKERLGRVPNISISADELSDVLIFSAAAETGDDAALNANTWAETYVAFKQQSAADSLGDAVDRFQRRLAVLRTERQEVRAPLDALSDQIAVEQRIADQLRRDAAASGRDGSAPFTTELQDQLQREYDRLLKDLEPELDLIDTEIEAISDSITRLQLDGELSASGVATIIQVAASPANPVNAPLSRNLLLAVVVGGLVGVGLALLAENLDRTVKTEEDITTLVGLPVLATIPKPAGAAKNTELALSFVNAPDGPISSGYQKLRTGLQFVSVENKVKSIIITSPNQSEGKTTTSSNLAWAMAALGQNVVLADIDFRRPRINGVFGVPLFPGLSNHILDARQLPDLISRVDGTSLVILPTGTVPPNPGDFLASDAFLAALRRLEEESDLVVLDAPPVLPVSDALAVARHVDATLLTVLAGSTTKDELRQAVQSLTQAGANIVGIALIGARIPNQSKYRYHADAPQDERGPLFANSKTRAVRLGSNAVNPNGKAARPRKLAR